MSTRGIVAWREKDGWKGIYNHDSSYPDHLGLEIYEQIIKRASKVQDGGRLEKLKIGMEELVRQLRQCDEWFQIYDFPKSLETEGMKVRFTDKSRTGHEWLYIIDPDKLTIEIWEKEYKDSSYKKQRLKYTDWKEDSGYNWRYSLKGEFSFKNDIETFSIF